MGSTRNRRRACFTGVPPATEAARQIRYKHHAYSQIAATDTLEADGSIVSAGVPRDIAAAWVEQLASANGRAAVLALAARRGLAVGVLAGLYATRLDVSVEVARPDFLFFCFKNVHLPLFAPVIAALRARRPDATIAFSAPVYDPTAREGLTLEERDAFAVATGAAWVGDAVRARPGVTVIADCVADRLRGHRRIVNLGHGLISKGQYYGDYPLIGRENLSHEICVPGPWHASQLRPHLYIPIHVTGMSKLDGLFRSFDEAAFRTANGFAPDERLLLWCPTFNPELTGLTVIGADIRRLISLGTVVIKMHGTTDPALSSALRTQLAGESRVRFVDCAADATPYMRCASLMITDVSSVMFEFAALDRPIVLVDNPRQASYPNYRPDDIEYRMRNVGPRVTDIDELVAAVRDELAQPDRFSPARRAMLQARRVGPTGRLEFQPVGSAPTIRDAVRTAAAQVWEASLQAPPRTGDGWRDDVDAIQKADGGQPAERDDILRQLQAVALEAEATVTRARALPKASPAKLQTLATEVHASLEKLLAIGESTRATHTLVTHLRHEIDSIVAADLHAMSRVQAAAYAATALRARELADQLDVAVTEG